MPRVIGFLEYEPQRLAPRDHGKGLVEFRRVRGMSQEELAHALGVDPSTLARWDKGEARPTGRILDRVMETPAWRDGLRSLLEAAESL